MARKFSAPGIKREETDLSEIVAPAGTSVGATVGDAEKGISNSRVLLNSDQKYITTFGEPNSQKYTLAGYGAVEFLQDSDSLYYVRATNGTEIYATMGFDATSGATSAANITADSSQVLLADADYLDGNSSTDIKEYEEHSLGADLFVIGSIGPGTYGNNVGIRITTPAVTATVASASYDWGAGYDDTENGPNALKIFKIEVFTKTDNQAASPWGGSTTPVETFLVSRELMTDPSGKQMFLENVINGVSEYIYIKDAASGAAGATMPMYTLPIDATLAKAGIVALSGGADSATAVGSSDINTAWNLFKDKEKVSINICICPDVNSTIQTTVGSDVAAARMDAIAVVQAEAVTSMNEETIAAGANYSYPNGQSYVAIYAGWDQIYDTWHDRNIYLPKCIFGAVAMARTDNLANTWDAPAGINRGILPSIGQNVVFTESQIGYLYDRNINTSKRIPGTGHVIWGQKTAQKKKSALDRINVRRLLLYIENSVEPSLLPFLFEGNTDKTRLRVFSIVDDFMRTVESGGGVTQYEVVCDESNNTAQIIDNNQLNVDIYVQPTKTIEFIKLQVVVTRTGVSFEEVK